MKTQKQKGNCSGSQLKQGGESGSLRGEAPDVLMFSAQTLDFLYSVHCGWVRRTQGHTSTCPWPKKGTKERSERFLFMRTMNKSYDGVIVFL